MNKNEFVGAVAAKANISQAAAKEAVDAALQVIAEALKDNNDRNLRKEDRCFQTRQKPA